MTYKELYPESLTSRNGLIYSLSNLENIPWSSLDNEQKHSLEVAYSLHSGFKPLLDTFCELSSDIRVSALSIFYLEKWKRLFDAYQVEFNILDGYSITETGIRNKNKTSDSTTTYGRKVDESTADTGTLQTVDSNTNNLQSNTFGFNSTASVPANMEQETIENNTTETHDLITTRESTNSGTDTNNDEEAENEEYSITKSGNIGYISPQELIRQTFELWRDPYFKTVFEDIDRMITLLVY